MALAAFDTHKFVRKLKGAGFNEEQAEVLIDAVRESQESSEVVAKADLRGYESANRADFQKLELRLDALEQRLDAKHETLRKDMDAKLEKLKLNLIIWLGSIVFLVVNAGPILPKLLNLIS